MNREKRLAGRAIRKARREQRDRELNDALITISTFAQDMAAAFDALGHIFATAVETIAAAARQVVRSFVIAGREQARREFEWRLSFRALEAPRHEPR